MKAVIAFPLTTTTTVGCFCVTCLCYEYRSNVAAATTSVQAGFEVLTQVYTLSDESSYCKYLHESGKNRLAHNTLLGPKVLVEDR